MPPEAQIRNEVQNGKPAHAAHDDEARQHEDDGRQRARRRGHCLHDVVLEDRGALEARQHGHGDHSGGNGGGEGQPDLQSEIDVGGGEDGGDRDAEDDAPNRQLDHSSLFPLRHASPRDLANPAGTLNDRAADAPLFGAACPSLHFAVMGKLMLHRANWVCYTLVANCV